MIINLKNSKNLSTNDLRNSYQVQWWYIHEFYTGSLSFAVLNLANSSLDQTPRDNIAYYLGNQYISYLEKCALWVRISFWWRFTKKNNNSQSCLECNKVITPLKCKKKRKLVSIPSNFWALQSEWVPKELLWSIPETLQQQPQQQHNYSI